MTEEEREEKLQDLCTKIATNFTKEGKASGLPAPDGILALINFTADAIVQVGKTSKDTSDFTGWSISTFFNALKFYADQYGVEMGFIMERVTDGEDDSDDAADDAADDDDDDDGILH